MKKFISVFLCVMLIIASPFCFAACKKSANTKIRLSEVTRSIFYAPMYIAINKGYFAEYGIEIELTTAGGADKVMTAITSKSADIGLMGPEATIYCHVNGQKNYPVIFGQLTQRDGSFLVGREKEPDFQWSNLKGTHILAGRPGGVPAMTLQYVIEQKGGLTLDDLNFDTKVAFDLMVGAFEGSTEYDYCTMFEPTASEFEAAGKGFIVASVGEASGDVPYTAFSTSKKYLSDNRQVVTDFLKAIVKGYNYLLENTPETVAEALAPSFAGIDKAFIASSIKRYLEIDAWCHTPVMSESSFNKLQDIMQNSGNLAERADFSIAVDNSIAESL